MAVFSGASFGALRYRIDRFIEESCSPIVINLLLLLYFGVGLYYDNWTFQFRQHVSNPLLINDVCFGAVGSEPRPEFCNLPSQAPFRFSKVIWFVTDGFPVKCSTEILEHYKDHSYRFDVEIPGIKFSHAIYTSWLTGELPINFAGKPIQGDNLYASMRRGKSNVRLEYEGPEWSFLAVAGESNYREYFADHKLHVEPLSHDLLRAYPFLFEEKENGEQPFYADTLPRLEQMGHSLIAHSGVFDHIQHGVAGSKEFEAAAVDRDTMEKVRSRLNQDLLAMKDWIDAHPDYLLIVSSDHGVDDFNEQGSRVTHGYSANSNEGYMMLYNPAFSGPHVDRIQAMDVAPTISFYLHNVDIPYYSIGNSHTYYGEGHSDVYLKIAKQNLFQLSNAAKARSITVDSDQVENLLSIYGLDDDENAQIRKEIEELNAVLREKMVSTVEPPVLRYFLDKILLVLAAGFLVYQWRPHNWPIHPGLLEIAVITGITVSGISWCLRFRKLLWSTAIIHDALLDSWTPLLSVSIVYMITQISPVLDRIMACDRGVLTADSPSSVLSNTIRYICIWEAINGMARLSYRFQDQFHYLVKWFTWPMCYFLFTAVCLAILYDRQIKTKNTPLRLLSLPNHISVLGRVLPMLFLSVLYDVTAESKAWYFEGFHPGMMLYYFLCVAHIVSCHIRLMRSGGRDTQVVAESAIGLAAIAFVVRLTAVSRCVVALQLAQGYFVTRPMLQSIVTIASITDPASAKGTQSPKLGREDCSDEKQYGCESGVGCDSTTGKSCEDAQNTALVVGGVSLQELNMCQLRVKVLLVISVIYAITMPFCQFVLCNREAFSLDLEPLSGRVGIEDFSRFQAFNAFLMVYAKFGAVGLCVPFIWAGMNSVSGSRCNSTSTAVWVFITSIFLLGFHRMIFQIRLRTPYEAMFIYVALLTIFAMLYLAISLWHSIISSNIHIPEKLLRSSLTPRSYVSTKIV
eukprot:TRINITY_DN1_c0_g1::TRINITY_DN1_c0_g1_i1::g.14809::m.14809 TRINITY_DN1_c0_g1::TRINITY_DN1_c0_g1_i1::g.14809  ORF type:complete len:967 (+),score=122.21 TRINITY_DN1_c0_g1_i1:298-3198(+)